MRERFTCAGFRGPFTAKSIQAAGTYAQRNRLKLAATNFAQKNEVLTLKKRAHGRDFLQLLRVSLVRLRNSLAQ
jgi:hypothetical protein